jgi:hypothetical protein
VEILQSTMEMRRITMNSLNQNGALQIGTKSPFQHHLIFYILLLNFIKQIQRVLDSPPSPSSRLRSFVAIVLGANAPRITEESPSYNSERSDCLNHGFGRPDVASDREEGRHGAFIKFCLLNPLQVLRFGYLVSI